MQIAASLQSAITKPISGCVRIACSGLMIIITSLLQVVNRLAASCELRAGLMFTGLMQLDEVNRIDTTCWQIVSGWYSPQLASSHKCITLASQMVIMIIMVMIMTESDDSNNGDNDDS